MVYDRTSGLFRDRISSQEDIGLERILSRIDTNESFVSVVANPLEAGY